MVITYVELVYIGVTEGKFCFVEHTSVAARTTQQTAE